MSEGVRTPLTRGSLLEIGLEIFRSRLSSSMSESAQLHYCRSNTTHFVISIITMTMLGKYQGMSHASSMYIQTIFDLKEISSNFPMTTSCIHCGFLSIATYMYAVYLLEEQVSLTLFLYW